MNHNAWTASIAAVVLISAAAARADSRCKPVELPPLGDPVPTLDGTFTFAHGMNNAGLVVGRSSVGTSVDDLRAYAVLWKPRRSTTTLSGLTPQGGGEAFAINDLTQVVGGAEDAQFRFVPVVWTHGAIAALPFSGASGYASDVNNRGQIVGNQGFSECLSWSTSRSTPVLLPGLGGDFCRVDALNDHGIAVGMATLPSRDLHGVVWNGTVATDIHTTAGSEGMLYSELWDVNASGVAIGIGSEDRSAKFPIMWTSDRGIRRLPGVQTFAVNKWGVIAATSEDTTVRFELVTRDGHRFPLGTVQAPPGGIGGLHANDAFQVVYAPATGPNRVFFCALL